MKLSQFKFKLPEEQVAQYPMPHRDESRLMVLHKKSGDIEHRQYFKDILDYFDDKDVFIFNDTKVFPARLYGNKEKTGARIEVFLLRELNPDLRLWDVLVDPARKIRIGNKLYFGEDDSMVAAAERCASSTTARTTSSRLPSTPWARRRCPNTSSSGRPNPRTWSASSASSPRTKAP